MFISKTNSERDLNEANLKTAINFILKQRYIDSIVNCDF